MPVRAKRVKDMAEAPPSTPELPRCTALGDVPQAALANVHDAIALWIDTARAHGDPVPEPKKRRLLFA
jgi:predicted RNase H-like HicB family nuclease